MTLSKTMQRAVELAESGNGTLRKYAGGYWRSEPATKDYFGTQTVRALVRRGVFKHVDWKTVELGSQAGAEPR